MEPAERDTTDEWRIAPERTPTTVAELEGRIDLALATARSAEEAALEIGAASLEAAEQARRAAAMAERASSIAAGAVAYASAAPPARPAIAPARPTPRRSNGAAHPDPFEERVTAFRLRAEKVMVRLQRIEASDLSVGSLR
jgi:hypothetical protein